MTDSMTFTSTFTMHKAPYFVPGAQGNAPDNPQNPMMDLRIEA